MTCNQQHEEPSLVVRLRSGRRFRRRPPNIPVLKEARSLVCRLPQSVSGLGAKKLKKEGQEISRPLNHPHIPLLHDAQTAFAIAVFPDCYCAPVGGAPGRLKRRSFWSCVTSRRSRSAVPLWGPGANEIFFVLVMRLFLSERQAHSWGALI